MKKSERIFFIAVICLLAVTFFIIFIPKLINDNTGGPLIIKGYITRVEHSAGGYATSSITVIHFKNRTPLIFGSILNEFIEGRNVSITVHNGILQDWFYYRLINVTYEEATNK
jgi:hypothetical protein